MDIERFRGSPIGNLTRIRGMDGRTGEGYDHFAYVADPLGAVPDLSNTTWQMVTRAVGALARLDQASRQIPNPDLLRRPTLRREAQSTSALEGTFAPLDQVLAAEAEAPDRTDKALTEVLNYVWAADRAFGATRERPLTVGLLESVHGQLVEDTDSATRDSGRLRRCQVAVGSGSGSIEDARFIPMPNGVELEVAVRDLVDWINAPEGREPVVAAAMAHYQFETLHPFNDGNGRIGRLLIVLQLMSDGVIGEPLLSVSPWFEERRTSYQDHLAQVSATGEWEPWIQFFSQGLEESALDTAARVDVLLSIQRDYVTRLKTANVRGGLARDIVDSLIGSPIVTVPNLARRFGKTPQGVELAVQKLVALGILDGPRGSYNRHFVAAEVLSALSGRTGSVRRG